MLVPFKNVNGEISICEQGPLGNCFRFYLSEKVTFPSVLGGSFDEGGNYMSVSENGILLKNQDKTEITITKDKVILVTFSASGRYLLVVSVALDGNVMFIDLKTCQKVFFRVGYMYLPAAGICETGKFFFVSGRCGFLSIWKFFCGKNAELEVVFYQQIQQPDERTITSGTCYDNVLITGNYTGRVHVYTDNNSSFVLKYTWNTKHSRINCLYVKNESILASGHGDGSVLIRRIMDGVILKCLNAHRYWVTDVLFYSNGRNMATSSYDGFVKIWDTDDFKEQQKIASSREVQNISIDKAENIIAVTNAYSGTDFYECKPGNTLFRLNQKNYVFSLDMNFCAHIVTE